MYVLPNKKQINMDKLEEAFGDFDLNREYFLDAETGDVVLRGDKDYGEIIFKDTPKFLAVPKLRESTKMLWMKEFADEMVPFDSPDLAIKLSKVLREKNPAEKFMKILSSDKSGWIHGWSQWEADHIYEEIEDWFYGLPLDIEDDMSELDDGCPLCRAMKEGRNSEEDLRGAFHEAKFNEIVGNITNSGNGKCKK